MVVPPEFESRKDGIMSKETMTKDDWTGMLRAAGMDDEGMRRWHREFESRHPAKHQEFLAWLELSNAEIESIRERSRS